MMATSPLAQSAAQRQSPSSQQAQTDQVPKTDETAKSSQLREPIADDVDKLARRAKRIVDLRLRPNRDKKLAFIYYNKGLGKDDLMRGSPAGAFLDAPASFQNLVPHLVEHGYTVRDVPATAAELIARMKVGGRNVAPWAPKDLDDLVANGHPVLLPLRQYRRWFETKLSPASQAAVINAFGPPPGKIMTVTRDGQSFIVIPRIELGNVVLAPQPERGESQDDALLHSRDVPPPHNYLAFYWWLDEELKADAIVHWGTYGSPDHLPPPALTVGLSEGLRNVHDDVTKFGALENGVLREEFRKRISTVAREERIDEILALGKRDDPYDDRTIARIGEYVERLAEERTPLSLHVLGEPMAAADEPAYLVSMLGHTFLEHLATVKLPLSDEWSEPSQRAWLRAEGEHLVKSVLFDGKRPNVRLTPELQKDLDFARAVRARLEDTGQEIRDLLRGLDTGYVVPDRGPEPIRSPDSVPGRRSLSSLHPEQIPTRSSWALAVQLVDELLRTRRPKK